MGAWRPLRGISCIPENALDWKPLGSNTRFPVHSSSASLPSASQPHNLSSTWWANWFCSNLGIRRPLTAPHFPDDRVWSPGAADGILGMAPPPLSSAPSLDLCALPFTTKAPAVLYYLPFPEHTKPISCLELCSHSLFCLEWPAPLRPTALPPPQRGTSRSAFHLSRPLESLAWHVYRTGLSPRFISASQTSLIDHEILFETVTYGTLVKITDFESQLCTWS